MIELKPIQDSKINIALNLLEHEKKQLSKLESIPLFERGHKENEDLVKRRIHLDHLTIAILEIKEDPAFINMFNNEFNFIKDFLRFS